MKIAAELSSTERTLTLRILSIFTVSLFLFIMLMSAFVIIPKVNQVFESQHDGDLQVELALEAALFTRFVESQRTIIEDLATYPSLTSAVMLSDASNRNIQELLDNIIIGGEKGRLILQDIAGNVLMKTAENLQANYTIDNDWIESILSGSKAYHFQLLSQKDQLLTFKMSVPVLYNSYVEGLLSSEITVSLKDVFIRQSHNSDVAYKLVQGSLVIDTGADHIIKFRENSIELLGPNLTFIYITDDAVIIDSKRSLQDTILSVLLFSFVLSFLVLVVLGYKGLLQAKHTISMRFSFWKTYALPILVGVIGISASVSAYMMTLNFEKTVSGKALTIESQQKINAIRESIDKNLQSLDAVKAFYNATANVSRHDFKTFTAPLLANHRNIQALEWIPNVSYSQRKFYKKQAKLDGINHFSIREKNADGDLILAKLRDNYFPVYYVEPMAGNEKAIGFDLASNNRRLAALMDAEKHNRKVATAKINLVQEEGSQSGILVFNPIFKNDISTNMVEHRQRLHGFVLLVLRVGELITDTSISEAGQLSIYIEDISDANNPEIIYGNSPLSNDFSRAEILSVAGRSWRINTYSPIDDKSMRWSAWLILIGGVILSGIIALGIIHLIRRREIVEQLVNIRTAELTTSEEEYRAVVENAVDGLITIDEIGNIEKFNTAAQRIFGYSANEVIGSNIKMLMPEPYHGEHDGYLKNYHDSSVKKIIGIGRGVEGRRKDGSTFPMDLSVSEMMFGDSRKFSGIVRDISQRVALEQEREKFIEELTDSNEELERFAFVCSHDLQEPLRMIRSFSEKLQEHIAEDLENDPKGQKYFRFVTDGASRAQTLITDILAYSSISSNTHMLERVNIESLITVICNTMLDDKEANTGKITFDPLPELQGNKTQLFQLFQNLINNGMKYQKPDQIPHVHISAEDAGKYWTFIVKDNGIGMESRHFNKIFEVFQRLHRRSQFAGTGIGLSICKKVVERHGGTIWVNSKKGFGSTFYIQLLKPTPVKENS